MSRHLSKVSAVVFLGALLLAVLLFVSKPAASQSGSEAKPKCLGCSVDGKTTPMTADGHPDLNGFWNTPPAQATEQFQRTADGSVLYDFSLDQGKEDLCVDDSCQNPNQPSYTAAYLPKVKEIAASEFAGSSPLDPQMDCKPMGVPRGSFGGAMMITQTPQLIAVLYEGHPNPSSIYRVIYMDGRQHPKDLEPSYMGDSIGHWEGNTLVVDVTGLNADTWLGGDIGGKMKYTSIHSDKEHVVERWTRDGDVITYEATVDDPIALTKPWVITPRRVHVASPTDGLQELFCTTEGTLKAHYVKPDPEDKDIKYKCSGHRCDAPEKKNCGLANKQNCQ